MCGVLVRVACLCGWRACAGGVGGVGSMLAWVACLLEWRASVLAWVTWKTCLRGWRANLRYVVSFFFR